MFNTQSVGCPTNTILGVFCQLCQKPGPVHDKLSTPSVHQKASFNNQAYISLDVYASELLHILDRVMRYQW